ncbi:MAG: type II 3-dehydroquinate dehydratase [Desulfobacterales bacterium]|nr:type II 3-dehydroquinate dehydratase [Desulfobacterales bacterium]
MSATVHIINGPNLNMLGKREPEVYGSFSLDDINQGVETLAKELGISVSFFQSNHEGVLLDHIHKIFEENPAGIIINPGAFTHTSVALRDALLLLSCPIVEVHLSNIHKREAFRHKSMIADIATGQMTGFGWFGYHMALRFIHNSIAG